MPHPVLDWMYAQQHVMVQVLADLVAVDTGPGCADGIMAAGNILLELLKPVGVKVTEFPSDKGRNLLVEGGKGTGLPVLILGHLDTVFPRGTTVARPFRIEGDRACGPGVCDMKGGLVTAVFALRYLALEEGDLPPVIAVFNADEETGSRTSRSLIEQVARRSAAAFVMEPARPDGSVVVRRKGVAWYRVVVRGRAAHAGSEPDKGSSAVEELAHKILQFSGLNDPSVGLTVNVGRVLGGTAANVVAEHAEADVDLRFWRESDLARAAATMRELCSKPTIPGTGCQLEEVVSRPPLEVTPESAVLHSVVQDAARDLGFAVEGAATGAYSDGNIAASVGIPVVDGMGPVGGGTHSDHEYVELGTLPQRAALLALSIRRAAQQLARGGGGDQGGWSTGLPLSPACW